MTSPRIVIRPVTSCWGRRQFSVEKAYSVKYWTPYSTQPSMIVRMFSVPARWPASRGRPRCFAHRPFPSMMIAMWAGTAASCSTGPPRVWGWVAIKPP
jgi:hypothetical protein